MRILVLGAGAVGGYFGGRMTAMGSDVTFLVREKRASQMRSGLRIQSPHANSSIAVKPLLTGEAGGPFDLIILSCKAYGLSGALDAIAPYAHDGICILPLLNGYSHIEQLEKRFPSAIVCGGTAGIVATLTEDGTVRQLQPSQVIEVGSRQCGSEPMAKLDTVVKEMRRAGIDASISSNIELSMWEKWTFLATLAAVTCLMREPIGKILATDYGREVVSALFDESVLVAKAEGYAMGNSPTQDYRSKLFDQQSMMTASMLRDMEAGNPTEADHILGDMIARGKKNEIATPLLMTAYSRLQLYERKRATE